MTNEPVVADRAALRGNVLDKSLLAGDGDIIAKINKERVVQRGYGSGAWGWKVAYEEMIAI